jgi:dienelactone hydrolase
MKRTNYWIYRLGKQPFLQLLTSRAVKWMMPACCFLLCFNLCNAQAKNSTLVEEFTSAYHSSDSTLALREIFAAYDKRFVKAHAQMPRLFPWDESDREQIVRIVKQSLAVKDEWIPDMRTTIVGRTTNRMFTVDRIQSASWNNCYGAAFLYLPLNTKNLKKLPVVLLACGHGDGGKLYTWYRLMAENLASNGMAVLVPDNIGQGERTPMGHFNPVGVFDCGLTVQGLIVMETLGWLNWIHKQEQFDTKKIAVCGNSGGGTLGLFLAALAPDKFSTLVCSGYPSSFEFVARKEKVHCRCNLIRGIVGKVEMWQVLGCFAPKPMFILQGKGDEFFPVDLFYPVARNVGDVYMAKRSPAAFKAEVFMGLHGWDEPRLRSITQYLCKQFDLTWNETLKIDPTANEPAPNCYPQWPQTAINIDRLSEQITGKKSKVKYLWEVFSPALPAGKHSAFSVSLPRGDGMDIFAQYEAFLGSSDE